MQQGKADHLKGMGGIGQEQQPQGMTQHAGSSDVALVDTVANHQPQSYTSQLPDCHQHDHQSGLRYRISEPLFEVGDGMHIDRRDHQQRKGMSYGEQPKSLCAQGLPGGKFKLHSTPGCRVARAASWRWRQAINGLTMVLRTAAYHRGQGQTDQYSDQARTQGGVSPPEMVHGPGYQRHGQPAQRQTQTHQGQRSGAVALKPLNQRHREREIPSQTGTHSQQNGTHIEPGERVDLAQRNKAQPKHNNTDPNHGAGSKAVHQHPQQGANNGCLHRLKCSSARQSGLAPAALV